MQYIKNLIHYPKQIKSVKDLLWWLFVVDYYLNVKLLHYLTFRWYSLIGYLMFVIICLTRIYPDYMPLWQACGIMFITYTLVIAITNFVFAKISFTRRNIDKILGSDFVTYHQVWS